MDWFLRQQSEVLLKQALNNPTAEFRDSQWEAIESLLNKQRLLVVQRTGWGKSLVYFLATRLLRDRGSGLTLIISPLLSLMRNQIMAAERIGIQAATINSSNQEEWQQVQAQLLGNKVDILLISPERLSNTDFRESVLMPVAENIGLFVVDEAHCISDWGHDFRPDYRRIVRILQALPVNIPVLATTATANNRVVKDVVEQLGPNLYVLRGSLTRSSLHLQNIYLPNQVARMAWLAEHLPKIQGSGIIYTLTVKDAQCLAEWLKCQGIDAHAYYGDQNTEEREELEHRLLNNQIKALVATTALGMGFDKPDLSFVVHFQCPSSVVHYYQQVGRAGRAIEQAYGILLSGKEDQEITNYFIQSAFPPEAHVEEVLAALNQAEEGLSLTELEQSVNLSRSQIEKVLKILVVETPAPVSKQGSYWCLNPVQYVFDREKVNRLIQIRRDEQARMQEYIHSHECLMNFLKRELDDSDLTPCGHCAICLGKPLLAESYSIELANKAVQFLRRLDRIIEPRKRWPAGGALETYDWSGQISKSIQAEKGRALCLYDDGGWGAMVRRSMQSGEHFDEALVKGAANMIQERWQPAPFPTWVTCVPSLRRRELVPNFAQRLAQELSIPFIPCIQKTHQTEQQKLMNNSYKQARNIADAFAVVPWANIDDPVLLVDDVVKSGWTFTIVAALLRHSGSGPVFPLALAAMT